MPVRCLTSRHTITAAANFDTNCSLLSVRSYFGISYGMVQLFTNTIVAFVRATVVTGMALVNLVYRTVKKVTCLFPGFVLGTRRRMSITTNKSGLAAGNERSFF